MYFLISLGLGYKGFYRKLYLIIFLFNLYLGLILRNIYLFLKVCISLGNLYVYIEIKRCIVLYFDINVVRYFLFICLGKILDYNIKF